MTHGMAMSVAPMQCVIRHSIEAAVYYFIEPMVENDIERVQEIERRSFSTPWSANTYRHELRHPSNSRYIVARASTTPPPPRNEGQQQRRRSLSSLLPSLF